MPEIIVKPLLWLASKASDGITGKRLVATRWRDDDTTTASSAYTLSQQQPQGGGPPHVCSNASKACCSDAFKPMSLAEQHPFQCLTTTQSVSFVALYDFN